MILHYKDKRKNIYYWNDSQFQKKSENSLKEKRKKKSYINKTKTNDNNNKNT